MMKEPMMTGKPSTKETKTKPCQYCGKELPCIPQEIPELNRTFWLDPKPCECAESQKAITEKKRQERERIEREEKAERAKLIQSLFSSSGLPKRFADRTFERFKLTDYNKKAFETAVNYAKNFLAAEEKGIGLNLVGSYGTGKTHLAAAITLYLIKEKRIGVKFGTVTTLLSQIRNTFEQQSKETEREVISKLINARLLVLDDLGKEKPTEWVEQTVYEIINARYENNKPIIVTTNISFKDLNRLYGKNGPAIFDRLAEMTKVVKLDGPSWRGRNDM